MRPSLWTAAAPPELQRGVPIASQPAHPSAREAARSPRVGSCWPPRPSQVLAAGVVDSLAATNLSVLWVFHE